MAPSADAVHPTPDDGAGSVLTLAGVLVLLAVLAVALAAGRASLAAQRAGTAADSAALAAAAPALGGPGEDIRRCATARSVAQAAGAVLIRCRATGNSGPAVSAPADADVGTAGTRVTVTVAWPGTQAEASATAGPA